jgi:hypothetical protein
LPAAGGVPIRDPAALLAQATAGCAGVRTLTAELALSGRVNGQRIRGRVLAGLSEPARMRLEGVAPFGPPGFIVVATDASATLLLPRDERVLTGEPPDAVVEALAGVRLDADELRGVLAGCGGLPRPAVRGERVGDWLVLTLADDRRLFFRDDLLVAAVSSELRVDYADFASGTARRLRVSSPVGADGGRRVDLVVAVNQLQTNVPLGDDAFKVEVPIAATPLTLEELRQAGPLGQVPPSP